MSKKKVKALVFGFFKYALILSTAFTMILPFAWMLSSSFKDDLDVFEYPIRWIPEVLKVENYTYIWSQADYPQLFMNTLKLTVIIVLLQLITCSLAAYAFSKINFPERDKLFLLYLATLMVPYQVVMIPQFSIIKMLGLNNTHMALILIGAFSPMGVFMMKQFFEGIPEELSEAARIDGMAEFGIYARLILPLSKPVMATLTIYTAVNTWNDFLAPLIYINSKNLYTIQLGMRNMISEFTAQYGPIMAASVVSVIPVFVLYVVFQRFFVESVVASGVKG